MIGPFTTEKNSSRIDESNMFLRENMYQREKFDKQVLYPDRLETSSFTRKKIRTLKLLLISCRLIFRQCGFHTKHKCKINRILAYLRLINVCYII